MARSAITATILVVALTGVAAAGCGGGDDDKAATDPSNTQAARDAEEAARKEVNRRIREEGRKRGDARSRLRRRGKPRTAAERARAARRVRRRSATQRTRDRDADRRFDREFDRGFRESRFERLVAKLPLRRPPLYVQQYITTTDSHTVHTAVDRARFLCRMTPTERRRAVERFFRDANRVMRAGGVDDFVQVVTVTSQTAQNLPVLARARRGSVSLTARGRERNPC